MNDRHQPKTSPPEAALHPGRFLWSRRTAIAGAGAILLLVVVATLGPSWFANSSVDLPSASPPPKLVAPEAAHEAAPEAKPLEAAELMRKSHYQIIPDERNMTGSLRKRDKKTPVVLYRRGRDIQFQHLHAESGQWQAFHLRQGTADSRQLELFGRTDGKNHRFPSERLGEAIEGTDVTYEDLAMPFLYWPEATRRGSEEVMGQDCWVIRTQNPGTAGNYAFVRVWIHKETLSLLQVVGYDQQGAPLKKMLVKDITMEAGPVTAVVDVLLKRPLRNFGLKNVRFHSYDPILGRTTGITDLEFGKSVKPPPRETDA